MTADPIVSAALVDHQGVPVSPPPWRVLVCGGRDFGGVPDGVKASSPGWYPALVRARTERAFLRRYLSEMKDRIACIIHGAYRGADSLADYWARENRIEPVPFPADWKSRGSRAGPDRNQRMINEGRPDLVVAFPGGKGTADMIRCARAAGIPIQFPMGGGE